MFQIIVFVVTALFSVFAYIWLLIVLKWVSPDEVEIWEAIMTFILFPILVKMSLFCKIPTVPIEHVLPQSGTFLKGKTAMLRLFKGPV